MLSRYFGRVYSFHGYMIWGIRFYMIHAINLQVIVYLVLILHTQAHTVTLGYFKKDLEPNPS